MAGLKYSDRLRKVLDSLETQANKLDGITERIKAGQNIYVCGNGGSYSNGSHLVLHLREVGISAYDLMADVPVLTALSNDYSYASAARRQLRERANKQDILIVISASGDSENILLGLAEARRIGMTRIGLLGFGGGAALSDCHLAIVFEVNDYGPIEDGHSVVIHMLKEALAK